MPFMQLWPRTTQRKARRGRNDASSDAVVVSHHDAAQLVLRHRDHEHPLTRVPGYADAATLADLFIAACDARSSARGAGTRRVDGVEADASARHHDRLMLGDYEWQTYGDIATQVSAVGAGLRALGLTHGDTVAILGETSMSWFVACHGSLLEGLTVATVYTSLGANGVAQALGQCAPRCVFTDAAGARLMTAARVSTARVVLLPPRGATTGAAQADNAAHAAAVLPPRTQLITLAELAREGIAGGVDGRILPKPHDIALIMYTSGSSGQPKGVLVPHSAVVASIAGLVAWNRHAAQTVRPPSSLARLLFPWAAQPAGPHDLALAYLPLAHIFEFVAEEAVLLAAGVPTGFGHPHTLTENAPAVGTGCCGDAAQLGPTIFTAVPAVLDRIVGTVKRTVAKAPAPMRWLFAAVLAFNGWALDTYGIYSAGVMSRSCDDVCTGRVDRMVRAMCCLIAPLLGAIVFRRPRQVLGGRVRLILSGGAPLSPDSHRFLQIVLGCPVVQGYGLTETCCAGTLGVPGDTRTGAVGGPIPSVLIKLVPWPDGGYTPADKPHPRGEVHIGGPAVAVGYHQLNDLTSRDFYTDAAGVRWFCTGDIGALDMEQCTLRIIDRKKDLVKLSRGEYLALGKVEAALVNSTLATQIMVVAESHMRFPAVLVVPNMAEIRRELVRRGVSVDGNSTDDELRRLPMAEQVVLEDLRKCASRAGLESWEAPHRARLVAGGPWTPERGLVTAALKVRRGIVKQAFKGDVDALIK